MGELKHSGTDQSVTGIVSAAAEKDNTAEL
jgi:hypothetical protein